MYKLILVEDEPILRRGLLRLVDWAAHGFALSGSAASGIEALDLIDRMRPDLVVSDIRMPELDGIGLIEAVRARGYCCEFIFLTGFTDFEYTQSAIRHGALDYVLKLKLEEDLPPALRRAAEAIARRGAVAENSLSGELLPAQKLRQYVDLHYGEELSLSSIADALSFNASYLSAVFSKCEGMTYSEYLQAVRMEHAKTLLLIPGTRVADVAHRVGYPDERHFGRCFKAHTGMTPKAFRESQSSRTSNQ